MLKKLALVLLLLPVMQTNADVEPEGSQSPAIYHRGSLTFERVKNLHPGV